MPTTIKMPQLGESVTEGTIERWLVKEGDTVEQYDPLFEVVTDKVNAEVPAEIAGTITKIIVPDGETVAVGTALAEIDAAGVGAADGGAAATDAAPAATDAAPAPEAGPPADAPPAEAPSSEPAAEPAATTENEAPASAEAAAAAPQADETEPAAAPPAQPAAQPTAAEKAAPPTDGSMRMTPAVRRLVREHNLDVARITGTGSGGRVTREDVLQAVAQGGQPSAAGTPGSDLCSRLGDTKRARPDSRSVSGARSHARRAAAPAPTPAAPPPVPSAAGGDTEIALSQMRKGIAAKMTQVKQTVPHAYTVVEVDMPTSCAGARRTRSAYKAREGIGHQLRGGGHQGGHRDAAPAPDPQQPVRRGSDHPQAGDEHRHRGGRRQWPAGAGHRQRRPAQHQRREPADPGPRGPRPDQQAAARRDPGRHLHGQQHRLVRIGIDRMPIINSPEVAILSMEAIVKRPRVVEVDGSDVITIRPMMNMTCSFDHRVLDGAQVGFFLADVRKRLEAWSIDTPLG